MLEYSSRDESTYLDPEISQNLADKSLVASPLVKKRCRCDTDFDAGSPVNQRQLQSPCSKGLLSPSTRAALSILAQSTPKPSISNTTRSDAMNDDLNLPRDTHLLAESSSLSCLKEQFQGECDVTSRSAEARCSLETSDLSFGSPSRSFEAAMARETDRRKSDLLLREVRWTRRKLTFHSRKEGQLNVNQVTLTVASIEYLVSPFCKLKRRFVPHLGTYQSIIS